MVKLPLLVIFCFLSLRSSSSLQPQGMALMSFRNRIVGDPTNALSNWGLPNSNYCSWFGVHCYLHNVVSLHLMDLGLVGTLSPLLSHLLHLHSLILRNNSFHGFIPPHIFDLNQLRLLDLSHNNFAAPIPIHLSPSILRSHNNKFLHTQFAETNKPQLLSQHRQHQFLETDNFLRALNSHGISFSRGSTRSESYVRRSLLQLRLREMPFKFPRGVNRNPRLFPSQSPTSSPSSSNSLSLASPSPSPSPSLALAPSPSPWSSPSPSPANRFDSVSPAPDVVVYPPSLPPESHPPAAPPVSAQAAKVPATPSPSTGNKGRKTRHNKAIIWSSIAGVSLFLIILAAAIICSNSKMVSVKPWATGLSGQLQRAFVSGVPKLKRSELELACEDFSNIIGSLIDGIVYKGTLSSGVEIAVVSSSVTSYEQWSKNLETQFRKKIETLSKVNHKNFVNLIGYCEEDKPFTRMMVFEYAPNGTLFEHLHIKEAERLDWRMRLRVVMGVAYCLEHMHQLKPPIPHRDLQSSAVYLADDYAAKISDFSFWNEGTRTKMRSPSSQLLEATLTDIGSNVFSFGLVLFEIITGRMPYMEDNWSVADWVWDYLDKNHIPNDIIDPTLSSYSEEEVQRLFWIIRECLQPDPKARPTMREVVARLREITGMAPDVVTPKLSPLWWAELEVLSMDGN